MKNFRNRALSIILSAILLFSAVAMSACGKSEMVDVTLVKNNGESNQIISVKKGDTLSQIPAPTKDQHVFDGWYTSEAFAEGDLFLASQPINQPTTLYAFWKAEQSYLITFNLQDTFVQGIGAPAGEAISAPAVPTKEGFVFDGWYTDENYTVKYNFNTMPARDFTLYGRWKLASDYVSVNFYARNNATSSLELLAQSVVQKGEQVLEPELSLKSGMVIAGWFLENNFQTRYTFNTTASANLNLYTYYYTQGLNIQGNVLKSYSGTEPFILVPHQVTEIAPYAFLNSTLRGIEFDGVITSIGESAFYGAQFLNKFEIPSTVTSIGTNAFFNCRSLTSIAIPNAITQIPDGLLTGADMLKSITLANNTTAIGSYAFADCSSLTSFPVLNSLQSVGSYAFSGAISITSLTIPASLTSIGEGAFIRMPSLRTINLDSANPSYALNNGNITNKAGTELQVYIAREGDATYTIPEGIARVAPNAFSGNSTIKHLIIPSNVTIGLGAFSGTSFQQITMPSLASIADSKRHFSYMFGAITPESNGIESVYVPYSLETVNFTGISGAIDSKAFYGCSQITAINGLENVTEFGEEAFYYCASLKSISLLTQQGARATFTTLGESAIAHSGITSLYLSSNLTNIASSNFNGLRLTTIEVHGDSATYSARNNALFNKQGNKLVKVPYVSAYTFDAQTTEIASGAFEYSIITELLIPGSVRVIEKGALRRMSQLNRLTVPFIGGYAIINDEDDEDIDTFNMPIEQFSNGTESTSHFGYIFGATLKTGLTPDEDGADQNGVFTDNDLWIPANFHAVGARGRVTLSGYHSSIADYAFYGVNLYMLDVSSSITEIGDYAFYGNLAHSQATSMLAIDRNHGTGTYVLNRNIKKIGKYAFAYNNAFSSITVVRSVTEMGEGAFAYTSPDIIVIEAGQLKDIPAHCFTAYTYEEEVEGIVSIVPQSYTQYIVLPRNVETIGNYAFERIGVNPDETFNVGLAFAEQVVENGEYISDYLIFNDSANESKLRAIGEGAFGGSHIYGMASKLHLSQPTVTNTLVFSDSLVSVGMGAFAGCNRLRNIQFGQTESSLLQSIGNLAFEEAFANSACTITLTASNEVTLGNDMLLNNTARSIAIKVASGLVENYKASYPSYQSYFTAIA